MFPDAPTERGARHLRELADARNGVEVLSYNCRVSENEIIIDEKVKVIL